jgi:hypothetical protein
MPAKQEILRVGKRRVVFIKLKWEVIEQEVKHESTYMTAPIAVNDAQL